MRHVQDNDQGVDNQHLPVHYFVVVVETPLLLKKKNYSVT